MVTVNGAGATFPYPIYSRWFSDYEKQYKGARFNYQPIGSGGGVRQLVKGTVDFGASDVVVGERDLKKAAWPVKHIPTVLGAVAVVYHFPPGVPKTAQNLKLDGQTLAEIYLGKIRTWNHPTIAKLNPGLTLPAADLLVIRRAEGSGTTAVFADYLSKVSPEWSKKIGRGKSLRWPVGIGARGNDGVTNMVKQTPGGLGYVELAYAMNNQLPAALLKNRAGDYIGPGLAGIVAAAGSNQKEGVIDFTASITNAEGKGAYPIFCLHFYFVAESLQRKCPFKRSQKISSLGLERSRSRARQNIALRPFAGEVGQTSSGPTALMKW